MKTLFRWAFRLFILLIVLLVALLLLSDTIAREVIASQLRARTGLEVKIGSVNLGLLRPELTVENLVLYNQGQFGGSPFIEVPELHIEYDPGPLWSRQLHCTFVRFNLACVNFVEDKQGRRNFDSVTKYFASPTTTNAPGQHPAPKAAATWNGFRFTGIDVLNMTIGKATYLYLKPPSQTDQLKLNVDHQIFTNVKTSQDFSNDLQVALLKSGVNLMNSGNAQNWLHLFAPNLRFTTP